MPISSTAITGEYIPAPFYTHKTQSGQPIESAQTVNTTQQIQTNLSTVDDIPSANRITRAGFFSSKAFKFGIAALITCAVGAAIAAPLANSLSNSNQITSSSYQSTILTTVSTMTTTSVTTATSVTTTSATTTSTTSTSTATTSTSTSSTSSTTSTSTSSSTTTTTTQTTSTSSTSTSTSTTSKTTSTTSTTTTTTSVAASPSFWSFDNNTGDSLSIYSATIVNSATYRTPGIDGYGAALWVTRANSQYVTISSFRNLSYRSFTIEMWFYCTSLSSGDYGLVGQYYAQASDQSLHYIIRNYNLYLAFFNDDLTGSTVIQINSWYHVAFVFDYSSLTQRIYLNGKLDGSRTASSGFQGLSGATVIGKAEQIVGSPNYFDGYIDRVSLVMRTKNSSEIFDDATLVTWNSFDSTPYSDSGPLTLTVTSANVASVSGKVNQAISFTSNSSYYQVGGFVLLGVSSYPYSISLWVYPSSVRGSILVHLSTTTIGQGWCVDLMGFSSTGQIIVTVWGPSTTQVVGPILPANAWSNVISTYSSTNGARLYVNGTLINSTGAVTYSASGAVNILTLANYLQGIQGSAGGSCNSQSIVPNVYYGYIDEFRVYSRELNTTDIYSLANP